MAITSPTAIANGSDKTSGGTTISVTAGVGWAIGDLIVVVLATDNLAHGGSIAASSDHSSVFPGASSGLTKAGEYSKGTSAGSDYAVSVWYGIADSAGTAGSSQIVATVAAGITAKALTAYKFTIPASSTVSVAGTVAFVDDGTANFAALTVGSLTSGEYLWVRGDASEGTTAQTYTPTSTWTAMTRAASSGGSSATNILAEGEFKIATATTQTSDPTTSTGQSSGSMLVALQVSASGPTTWDGAATLAATAVAIAATGRIEKVGAATLAATAVSLAAAGVIEKIGGATLTGPTVALAAAGTIEKVGAATLAATAVSITAAGDVEHFISGAATLATPVSIAATAQRDAVVSATLAVSPTIAATAVKELVGDVKLGAPPATAVLDDFNRANGTLSSPWVGQAGLGSAVITGNAVANSASSTTGNIYGSDLTGDVEAYGTLLITNNNLGMYVHAFDVGGLDGYLWQYQGADAGTPLVLYRSDNGTLTELVRISPGTMAAGDKLLLRTAGRYVEGWTNNGGSWTRLVRVLDNTYRTGKLGIRVRGTTAILDDFGGGNVPSSLTANVTLAAAAQREAVSSATLTASSVSLAASGTVEKVGASTLAVAVTIAATASRDAVVSATLAATPVSIATTGRLDANAAATLAATAVSIAASAQRDATGAATLAITPALAASANLDANASATLPITITVFASADSTVDMAATLAATTVSITATGDRDAIASTTIPIAVTLTASATVEAGAQTIDGAATLAITPSITADSIRDAVGVATLTIGVDVVTAGNRDANAVATLPIAVSFVVAGAVTSLVTERPQAEQDAAGQAIRDGWSPLITRPQGASGQPRRGWGPKRGQGANR